MARRNQSSGTQNRNNQSGGTDDASGGDDSGDDDDDMSAQINAAVSNHLTRKMPGIIGPAIAKAVEAALGPLREQLTTIQGTGENQGQAGQGDQAQGAQGKGAGAAQGQGGQQAVQSDPQVKALMGQVADLTSQLKRQQEQTQQQEAEGRNARRDAMLTEGLSKLGVDKHRMRGALAIARDAMTWDADAQTPTGGKGAWVWRAQRNGYTEDLTVDSGLAEWGKGDEGKSYIAASPQLRSGGGGGAGTQPNRQGGGAGGGTGGRQQQVDPAQQKQATAQKLFDQVSDMLGGGSVTLGG